MLVFDIIILIILIVLTFLSWRNFNSKEILKENQIIDQISLKLLQSQAESTEKLNQKLSQNQLSQLTYLQEQSQKTEQKLLNIQAELKSSLHEQLQLQYLEFEKLKTNNSENLDKLKNSIQERLEKAILNLAEINKQELAKLQSTSQNNFQLLQKTNQERLDQINTDVQKRLDENFAKNIKSVEEVKLSLGHMQATAQKMIDSTKSVDKLNSIFARTSSKAMGNFGEQYLETLLRDNLADKTWEKQIKIPGSNDIIDFVIHVDDKRIGIDSKFPVTKYQDYLESENEQKPEKLKVYLRTVMEMALDIGKKYYKDGFLDTLFLYLPSDSMYNEVINNQKTLEFLQKQKVTPTSPSTIFPLIMLIKTYEFKAKVNQNAEFIIRGLTGVQKNIDGFKTEFRKLGDKIRQAQTNYDQADKNLLGVERNVLLLSGDLNSNNNQNEEALTLGIS